MGAEAQRLRQAVLQAALEGKLVAQDPNDEPASVLLERITAEKERLVKEKKLKNEKALSPVTSQEPSFEIPKNWSWARIGDVVQLVNGRAYKKSEMLAAGKYPLLRVGNLFTNEQWYYSDLALPDEKYCHTGDLLYSWSASFGPFIWEGPECIFHYHIWNVRSFGILRDYLYWFFEADKATILRSTTGIAMYHVSMENMRPRLIPVPPLEEQHRIVAKIAELMPLIDEFEQLEDELNDLEAGLPEKLKQAVLQAGIEGKLVSQDPDDEPASVLLERIADEKAQLVDDGKLRKQKELPPVKINEQPFDVPDSWEWCRYGEVASSTLGKTLNKSKDTGVPVEYLCSINIQNDTISLSTVKKAPFTEAERQKYRLQPGDLLICEGGDAGKSAIWNVDREMYYQNALHCSRFHAGQEPHYIKLLLDLYRSQGLLTGASKGMTIQHLVQATLNNLIVPLPPLAEQHRIVAKIEEVMPVIDSIKQDVSNAQRT